MTLNELKTALKHKGWSGVRLYKELGLQSRSSLYKKYNGTIPFTHAEIRKLARLSGIPVKKIKNMFDITYTKVYTKNND